MAQPPSWIMGGQQPPQPAPKRPEPWTIFDRDSKWPNRIGLFGAGLQDAGAFLLNQPNAATHIRDFRKQQEQMAAARRIRDAFATNDPVQIRAALADAATSGLDPRALIESQQYGQPELVQGGENPMLHDPLSGTYTPMPGLKNEKYQHKQMLDGDRILEMDSFDGGKTWHQTPGLRPGGRWQDKTPPKTTRVPHPSELFR